MHLIIALAAQVAAPDILVVASRSPVAADEIGVSATIIDQARIEALSPVQAIDLLRLAPGVSVAVSGARGSQAQVRIRGGEANHSLLFVDGIRFTDPAAGNEPRFELLNAEALGTVEIVRGPQSALWGSEALGGVIALESARPSLGFHANATGEYGSLASVRAAGTVSHGGERASFTIGAAHIESDGIDILGGGSGDRDGYDNDTISLKGVVRPGSDSEMGIAARYIDAYSEFDGSDNLTFQRADTLDNSTTRTGAARIHGTIGTDPDSLWSATAQAQYLESSNRNRNGATSLNRTDADRLQASGQLERRIALGGARHVLIAAAEYEKEDFRARDQQYGGATDQDRKRDRTALIGEWRGDWGALSTDIAVRHDNFSDFVDETTFRAAATLEVGGGLALNASYGEGIAQPTFFDLYGFFPGSFLGNPALRPETSRGYELGLRYSGTRFSAASATFDNRLRDEIVPTYDSVAFMSSTANVTGRSRRRGLELSAAFLPVAGFRLSANYTYLKASDQQVAGAARLREVRRPRHSANLAFDYENGPVILGGSLAYVGERSDVDFDLFPAPVVKLGDYLLASFRLGYRITDSIEAFGRVDNLGDADYQDAVGYDTPGRTLHAGLRLRLGT